MTADNSTHIVMPALAVEVPVTRSRNGSQLIDMRASTRAKTPSPRFVPGSITPIVVDDEELEPLTRSETGRDSVQAFRVVSPKATAMKMNRKSLIASLSEAIVVEDTSSTSDVSTPSEGSPPRSPSKTGRRTLTPEVNARVLEVRKGDLLGKTVTGVLSHRGKMGHFIKWNHREPDRIFISSQHTDECFPDGWTTGMKVRCTIAGLGPDWAQADRQHPFTQKVEKFDESKMEKPVSSRKGSAFFSLASGMRTPVGGVSRKASSFGTGWQKQGGLSRKQSQMSRFPEGTQKRAATASPRSPRTLASLAPSARCQSMSPRSPVRSRPNTATRKRGGKPKSNFVFSHSNRSVLSTDNNPMAIGRSDAVRSWRK